MPLSGELVDDAHNGVAFGMAEGVIPQTIVVFSHCVAFGAAGVVAVGYQAGNDAGGLMPHRCAIAVEGVKENVLAFGDGIIKAPPLLRV